MRTTVFSSFVVRLRLKCDITLYEMSLTVDFPPGYHLGHLVFKCLSLYADRVCQIDAATGKQESFASVLRRSIQLARALRAFGLKPGDVLAICDCNHLNLCIPFYAALFNGLPLIGIDPNFEYDEVHTLFRLTRPKIAFCSNGSLNTYMKAAKDVGLDIKFVTFYDGDCTMKRFTEIYGKLQQDENDFAMAEFDSGKIYAFLICTSGTSGKVKVAAFNHTTVLVKLGWLRQQPIFSTVKSVQKSLLLAPASWISNYLTNISAAIAGYIRLQTSNPDNVDHIVDIINKYRPQTVLFAPALLTTILTRKNEVDLTCFTNITITGCKVYPDVFSALKKLLNKKCLVAECYGQTEMLGPVLSPNLSGRICNCGNPTELYTIKLIDPHTGVEVKEANVPGEMLIKGVGFSEYYNDPEETVNAFTDDGFFKTEDLLYRDSDNNYYFFERIKTLIKCRGLILIPSELEQVINRHPGVKEVCVVGVKDPFNVQRPVACVVRQKGSDVTAQEIKDLLPSNLTKNKKLRGGVVFLDSLPYTSSGKIARIKLSEIVMNLECE